MTLAALRRRLEHLAALRARTGAASVSVTVFLPHNARQAPQGTAGVVRIFDAKQAEALRAEGLSWHEAMDAAVLPPGGRS